MNQPGEGAIYHQITAQTANMWRHMRTLAVVISALFLNACAGSPIGDALFPERAAKQDDSYCQSIGAVPGSQDYMTCRLIATQQRNDNHANAMAASSAALAAGASLSAANNRPAIQPMPSILPPPPIRCRSVSYGASVQTVCQ